MSDEIITLLRVHDYFQGVSDEILQEVARQSRLTQFGIGSVVHEPNVVMTSIGFVLRGRLKAVRIDARGVESLFRMIERGEQVGMIIGALAGPVPVRVVAVEHSSVLFLDSEKAFDLATRFPELMRTWLTTFAGKLRKHFFGAQTRRGPMILTLMHHSPTTHPAAQRLVSRLSQLGEKLAIFSDTDDWKDVSDVPFRHLYDDGRTLEMDEIHQHVFEWRHANRIIFDVRADLKPDLMNRLMEITDRVVYFVPSSEADAAIARLRAFSLTEFGWRDKTRVAWLLEGSKPIGPSV